MKLIGYNKLGQERWANFPAVQTVPGTVPVTVTFDVKINYKEEA